MNQNNLPINKLLKLIKKNGIKCLLPQNLTDEILHRMIQEADAIDNDTTDEIPSSSLLLAILHLASGSKITKQMEITIPEEQLMDYFSLYVTAIRLELMKRKGDITISDNSLPTLNNIFDKNRKMDISGLY